MIYLVVKSAFQDYQPGQKITDEAEVERIQASEYAGAVVRVNLPSHPEKEG